jgi:hypothetical protein
MLLAAKQTHKNKAFFMALRGFLWVRIMGISQNVMGSDYGSNISEFPSLSNVRLLLPDGSDWEDRCLGGDGRPTGGTAITGRQKLGHRFIVSRKDKLNKVISHSTRSSISL